MQTKLITDAKLISKAIDSIANRGKKFDADIHTAAMSTAAHYAETGDYTLANRLLLAMPKSSRRQALVAWFVGFTSLVVNTDKETKAESPLLHVKGAKRFDADAADVEPFWEFAGPEREYRQFDLKAALAALLKKAEHALEADAQDTSLVQPDVLAALRALATTPEAIVVSEAAQAASDTEQA